MCLAHTIRGYNTSCCVEASVSTMHAEELALSAVNAEAFHLNSVVFSETKSAATESDVISDSDRDDVCIS